MKRIHDITAVLRGLKIIKEVYCKNVKIVNFKTCFKVINEINLSKNKEILKDVEFIPKTLFNGINLILYETCTLANYKLKTVKLNESENNNQSLKTSKIIQVKSDTIEIPYIKNENSIKTTLSDSELDLIDKELIEEFRQQHPELIKKSSEKKLNPIPKSKESKYETTNNIVTTMKVSNFGQERKVPSSEIGRAFSFASLFARIGVGALAESTRRQLNLTSSSEINPFLTEANAKRIVDSLCKVRGAALKLGQMLSIQDSEFVSPQLQEIFERVRQNADFMPAKQMRKVLEKELGIDWIKKFSSFNEKPFAAASIGQVHRGVTIDGKEVAVKIQYPGIKRSIDSDINNLMGVLKFVKALPPGLHADKAIEVAKRELAWECDYKREAQFASLFASKFQNDPVFVVPKVLPELSTEQVLTTEYVDGVSLDKCVSMDQEIRDWIGSQMMRLCLVELFKLRTMQTDPNWANFLFNADRRRIYLIDFGSSREYRKSFIDDYLRVIKSAAVQDKPNILKYSRKLGFLTGFETLVMEQAHIDAVSILGEVFTSTVPFDFGRQSTTKRIKELIPVMLEHRLTSPPEETYSLHRKLAGGFLLCSKLKSRVSCSQLFNEIYEEYQFD